MPLLAHASSTFRQIAALTFLLSLPLPSLHAELPDTLILNPAPVGDGMLIDAKPWDQVVDTVNVSGPGATLGSDYGSQRRVVLEFAIPPKSALGGKVITKAELSVCSNEVGPSPATVEVFIFSGKDADGVVTKEDWNRGASLGPWLVEGKTIIPDRARRWPMLDVTEVVQKAIDEGSRFIGFRLVAKDLDPQVKKSLVVRMTEFGDKYPAYRPELKLSLH